MHCTVLIGAIFHSVMLKHIEEITNWRFLQNHIFFNNILKWPQLHSCTVYFYEQARYIQGPLNILLVILKNISLHINVISPKRFHL
jgi:hypothetical protein